VVDADDDAKESEDLAGSTPKDLAMETLQQYTGGLESAITITGYAMDQVVKLKKLMKVESVVVLFA
jgi:hypothetical protein